MKITEKYKNLTPKQKQMMQYKTQKGVTAVISNIAIYIILISIGYVILYPLMYMITSSFRSGESYFDPTITWITNKVTIDNYKVAADLLNYGSSLKNTIVNEIIAALIQLVTCAIIAYGLSRFNFKEKKILVLILFLTILLPVQMTILPTYENYAHMDILGILGAFKSLTGIELRPSVLDTPLVFYLPSLFGVGLRSGITIFIYMQFFKGFPYELEEAAWLDGCGAWRTFFKIVLPSSSVVIFTNFIFTVIWHWNDYFLAQMYIKSRENFTLAVSLSQIIDVLPSAGIGWNAASPSSGSIVMAACTLFVLPVLIMYLFLQKKFVKSIDRVGITG